MAGLKKEKRFCRKAGKVKGRDPDQYAKRKKKSAGRWSILDNARGGHLLTLRSKHQGAKPPRVMLGQVNKSIFSPEPMETSILPLSWSIWEILCGGIKTLPWGRKRGKVWEQPNLTKQPDKASTKLWFKSSLNSAVEWNISRHSETVSMLIFILETESKWKSGRDIPFPSRKDERIGIFMIVLTYMYCCLQLQYFTGGI